MLDKAVIFVFGIVFLLSICLSMFGIVFTLVQQIQFDSICRNAIIRIDLDGGLTNVARLSLMQTLIDKGYKDISLNAPRNIQYGETINFKVSAKGVTVLSQGLFDLLGFEGKLHYECKIISRKIHNLAFQ